MTDYRIQVTATKASWIADKAIYDLSARVITRRKGIPFPEGEFVIFDPGGHRKQIDSRGVAFLRLSTNRPGPFTTIASLESDPEVHDESEVVVPEKPIPISGAKKKSEDDKARAESAEALKRIREARRKPGEVQVLHDEEKLRAEIRESRQKGLPVSEKLGEPVVTLPGAMGNYWLRVFVPNKDGSPLAGVPVNVTAYAGGHRIMSDDHITDGNGIVSRGIRILAANTSVVVEVQNEQREFNHLEQVPSPPMDRWQWAGLVFGVLALGVALYAGTFLSILAP